MYSTGGYHAKSQTFDPLRVLGIWGFPKIRGTLFWGPYNKDPTI